MLAEITPQQLGEWLAYYRIDPWGEVRADLRHGIATAVLANVHRDATKRPEGYKPADFMPDFDPKPEQSSLAAKVRAGLYALPGRKAGTPKG